jgi:predicted membrane chloride channel (bestrophin family)
MTIQGIHGTEDASEELESVLTPAQLKKLDLAGNVPAQLMTEITRGLDRMNEHKVELIYQLLMDNDLTALHNYAAKTDRLAQTPTPVSYTRHISRSLMLWLLTMPVCSVGAGCPWWITGLGTALVSLFVYSYGQLDRMTSLVFCAQVSWLLLGIDDLGMQLEQPYTVMALKQFCEDVQVST